MELMKNYSDNYFDLAIVDPPYGIGIAKWDKEIPSKKYFKELFRVSKNQIIWGGNYFNLPINRGWLCWNKMYKKTGFLGKKNCEEFELAWTSLDIKTKIINFTDMGNVYGFNGTLKVDYNVDKKIHPTQKHIKLYEKLLIDYADKQFKILDTHLGSGSSAIAAFYYGCKEFVGMEINEDYYNESIKRIDRDTAQIKLL
jgi:site-specific DNA-methyltransferase (adenine-specific)